MITSEPNTKLEKLILLVTTIIGFAWCLYRLLANEGWILDDEPTHWYFSRSVWEDFSNLFHGWTRFGRNLLHFPISIFGITATRIYTLLLAFIGVFITYKAAKELGIKALWTIPALLIFQEWFPDLSYSVLTQTPTLLVWILGIYLALKKKLWLAAICFGYMSLIRHEGILVTGIWGLWVTFSPGGFFYNIIKREEQTSSLAKLFLRDFLIAIFTVLPIFIYNVGAYIYTNSIPFLIYFDSKPTDHYGSGTLYHYPLLLFAWLGLFSFILSAIGLCRLRKKDLHPWSLLILTYFGYFAAQTIIFWQGLFASGGYYHFIMPMAPAFALLSAKAIDFICQLKFGKYITYILLALIIHQGIFMKTHQGYHQNWDAIMAGKEETQIHLVAPPLQSDEAREHLKEAANFTLDYKQENQDVIANFASIEAIFGNYNTPDYLAKRFTPVNEMPAGTLFIWDCKMSELSTTQKLANFSPKKWKRIKEWRNSNLSDERFKENPEREFTIVVFEKVLD